MSLSNLPIFISVLDFFVEEISKKCSFSEANVLLKKVCGIVSFFNTETEFEDFVKEISLIPQNIVAEDTIEYGDFQTNATLANKIVKNLSARNLSPQIIIEPTCGKGNFILASLAQFKDIQRIIGIEIQSTYILQTKLSILDFFLHHQDKRVPIIEILHCSVFDFDFQTIAKEITGKQLLIIGNPPWVTNAKLGSLGSSNLPQKSNFKNQSGIDAITGKGNFDIAEYITISLIKYFGNANGYMAFLVKNAVIKNLIFEQQKAQYPINDIEKQTIDSKKEFNVSVDASLLFCRLNAVPDYICREYDFYTLQLKSEFGWVNSKFVSDRQAYLSASSIDGICPFEWRQGVKHDCSQVMELEYNGKRFYNKLGEEFYLENNLIFNILKSSDLKNTIASPTNKCTIITQQRIGQDTAYIYQKYPLTYNYLQSKSSYFNSRKSSIYHHKPSFSIFGIGDYSFLPYKIAISGLYKTLHFTLVLPQNEKPVMLDDTCYFIGFNQLEFAVYTLLLLNSSKVRMFLKSVSFADAKRMINKEVLMRIDLLKCLNNISESEIENQLQIFNEEYHYHFDMSLWKKYCMVVLAKEDKQVSLF